MIDLRSLLSRILTEGRAGQTDRCLTLETSDGVWLQLTWQHLNAACPTTPPALPHTTLSSAAPGQYATYTWQHHDLDPMEAAVAQYLAAFGITTGALTLTGDEIL